MTRRTSLATLAKMVLPDRPLRTRLQHWLLSALPWLSGLAQQSAHPATPPGLPTNDHLDHGPTLSLWAQIATVELLLTLAILAVLLPLLVLAIWRRFPQAAQRDLPVALGLFTVALALRWLLPVHTFVHENRAGLGQSLTGTLTQALVPIGGGLPSASVTVAWLLHQLGLPNDLAFFLVTAVASSLAVVGLYFLGTLVFAARLAGWSAAVLLALQPLAIALAPTEEPIVFATGALLLALPLVWLGARDRWWLPLLTGVLLLSLAATARDVTLPLTFCLPLVLLAAQSQRAWRFPIAALALLAVLVLPSALAYVLGTRLQSGGAVGLLGVPKWSHWIGWSRPFVPRWMAWGGIAALVWALVVAWRTRAWRPALVSVGCVLVTQLAGGLMIGGYFPGHLRHQSAALALLMLPIGGAWAARIRHPRFAVVGIVVLPALSLIASPASYRWDFAAVREYRFLADTLPQLPPDAHLHFYAPPWAGSLAMAPWLAAQQPAWRLEPFADIAAVARLDPASGRHYLLLDRLCFAEAASEADAETRKAWEPTPFGLAHAACARALAGAPWQEVARRPLDHPARPLPQAADLPTRDPAATLAVLAVGRAK